jgi:hypothetical protein
MGETSKSIAIRFSQDPLWLLAGQSDEFHIIYAKAILKKLLMARQTPSNYRLLQNTPPRFICFLTSPKTAGTS